MTEPINTDQLTPYSTIKPLVNTYDAWIPLLDRDRIASYEEYEKIYWGAPKAFKLQQRGDENPIYIPNARTIVDTTAHYLLKGLEVHVAEPEKNVELEKALQEFLDRERFYPRFHTAKHSGVSRGDYLMHITADPAKPEGRRISLTSVDPSRYFPEFDPDDIDKKVAVNLVDHFWDDEVQKDRIRQLRYWYAFSKADGSRVVWRSQKVLELENWDNPEKQTVVEVELEDATLPEEITTIPVYHFKNIDWQGQDFGSSEIRGFEVISGAINQAITDEEVALALEGLGVYATDAGRPVDDNGDEIDWEIAPARVMELTNGAFFKRVEGIKAVTPMLDHVKYLEQSLMEASSTFRAGQVEVQVAESGIALAIRFLPMLAKIEMRDAFGLAILKNLFFDLKGWFDFYESIDFKDVEIVPTIGAKLPENRTDKLNELNNMVDRNIVSKKYYRAQMKELGYVFPEGLEDEIAQELQDEMNARTPPELLDENGKNVGLGNGSFGAQGGRPPASGSTLPKGNQSNNANKPNESAGTEASNGTKPKV